MKKLLLLLLLMLTMPVCAQEEGRMQFGVRADL